MKTANELIEICDKTIGSLQEPHQSLAYHHTVEHDLFLETFTPEFVKELMVNQRNANSALKSMEISIEHIRQAVADCY